MPLMTTLSLILVLIPVAILFRKTNLYIRLGISLGFIRIQGLYKDVVNCKNIVACNQPNYEPVKLTKENRDLLFDVYKLLAGDMYTTLLFCARHYKRPPSRYFYSYLPSSLWPLLDACGSAES